MRQEAPMPTGTASRSIALALGLLVAYLAVEALGGFLTNSLALLADAGHTLSDAILLALSWAALHLSRRSPTLQIAATFLNSFLLFGVACLIFAEGYERLREPPAVQGAVTVAIAAVGLLVNLACLRLVAPAQSATLVSRGVWLHVAADALGRGGALVAGLLVGVWGWRWADPAMSLLIGLLIVSSAWSLFRQSLAARAAVVRRAASRIPTLALLLTAGIAAPSLCAQGLACEPTAATVSPVLPTPGGTQDRSFQWTPALTQSMRFLLLEHGFRLGFQPGTRRRLGGPFLQDWGESVRATGGWGDGDNGFLNYVGHPMQGTMSGYIQVQNDPHGRMLEFSRSPAYWRSRLKALAWNTAYSAQFEIGPISESSLGNVGQRKGTSGYVDHVMTPVGGLGWMLAEDALDRYLVRKLETGTGSARWRVLYRVALNPSRSFANVLRGRKPWHRDTRPWR